jgi:hypothetical protein
MSIKGLVAGKAALNPNFTNPNTTMASKSLFGAPAFSFTTKHALAQYAVTGCLNSTFYASAEAQLSKVLSLAGAVEPEIVAKAAIYCRTRGYMKDMPALLCASLAARDTGLLGRIFDRVIDDGKMLRNFVQILRSGAVGRKSLGTAPKRLVKRWFEQRDDLRCPSRCSPRSISIGSRGAPSPAMPRGRRPG